MHAFSIRYLYAPLLVAAALAALSACVYTDAEFAANTGTQHHTSQNVKNPGSIIISEQSSVGRQYTVIGDIEARGRSVNLLSSDPTREDVNEALRAEAAKQGADAVLNVVYQTQRTGLASRGEMKAHGQAVVFTE